LEEWWPRIEALIASADSVVFILSPDSVLSEVTRKELAFAGSLSKRVAPVMCRQVSDEAVPQALAKLNFVFFDNPAQSSADRLFVVEAEEALEDASANRRESYVLREHTRPHRCELRLAV
jgi:hypothetical protein